MDIERLHTAAKPTDEFNAIGAPSEDMKRKLLYLALTGNETVLSVFSSPGNLSSRARAEEQRKKDLDFRMLTQMVLASQERIEQFMEELDRLDEASTAALLENEERLRVAREELRKIRERAYEITRPDGTVTKVYRDGNTVRDDGGNEVDSSLIKPGDLPENSPTWAERYEPERRAIDLMRRNQEIREYQDKIAARREALKSGQPTDKFLEEAKAELDDMPDDVRAHLDAPKNARPVKPSESVATFETKLRPASPFSKAASGLPDNTDKPVTQLIPGASTPSPM